ncbi:hypothetical protein AB0M58_37940 [Streptomyces bobili]|uniref:hypothetical protein n=1 Tax=Streptomyces bobili TaxID=67280 RepID=UPI00341CBBEB
MPITNPSHPLRWTASEAVALLIGCQFLFAAGATAALGVYRSSTALIALTAALIALAGISVTVWLNFRKERFRAS